MNDAKYIGMDVHQATISVAVLDCAGKLVMEAILETKAETILQFIHGLRGSLHVTLEEGTCAAWLHDVLKPHVAHVLVCDPRKNALIKAGNKSDRIDARKLADLLYLNKLPVWHMGRNQIAPSLKQYFGCPTWSSRRMRFFTRSQRPVRKNHTVMPSTNSLDGIVLNHVWPLTGRSSFATGSFSNRRTSHPPRSTFA